jgi:hypothetical protein
VPVSRYWLRHGGNSPVATFACKGAVTNLLNGVRYYSVYPNPAWGVECPPFLLEVIMSEILRSIPEATIPEKKYFLAESVLDEVWNGRGLLHAVDDFYGFCRDRGMLSYYRKEMFREHFFSILKAFLVSGEFRIDPKFVPLKIPSKVI